MRAGRLRHTISIQERGTVRDDFAGASDQWTDVFTNMPASIEPLSGRELYSAQQNHSEVTVRIRIRYRAGILPAHRVMYRGQCYSILYVVNVDQANRELHLMCSIGVNEG